MKINGVKAVLAVLFIGFVGIFSTKALGLFKTESTKIPAKFEDTGEYRADDIRGSYSFDNISELFNIPLDHLADAFLVDRQKASTFLCKDLETIFEDTSAEIGTGSVKLFVAFYTGQPYSLDDTFLLSEGKEIIEQFGKPTPEQIEYLQSHFIEVNKNNDISKNINDSENNITTETSDKNNKAEEENQTVLAEGATYIKDLSKNYNIPIKDIADAFMISETEALNFQLKDIKNKFLSENPNINVNSVKLFIAFYNGISYDISTIDTQLPETASEIIKTKGNPLQEQLDYLESHTWTK